MVDDGCHQNFELTLCGQPAFQNRPESAQLRRRLMLTKIDRFALGLQVLAHVGRDSFRSRAIELMLSPLTK